MQEICTHRFLFFKRKEFWFYDAEKIHKGIYNVFCYSNEKDASLKQQLLTEQTSCIDLHENPEELFGQINRTFKYHIRKAKQIGVTTQINYSPTLQKCRQVMDEFAVFAKIKAIEWNPKRIEALQKLNKLIISEAFLREERVVTHMYLHDNHRVVLLHSYHQQNYANTTIRGYANKRLHWKDILSFKSFGLKVYDFGGINMEQHPGISRFKLSYGGKVLNAYSYIEVYPPLASIIKLYKRITK